MCNNWNIPEMELAQYTIQDGTEVDRYESLTLGLLDDQKGILLLNILTRDLYKRTFASACISVFFVIND